MIYMAKACGCSNKEELHSTWTSKRYAISKPKNMRIPPNRVVDLKTNKADCLPAVQTSTL